MALVEAYGSGSSGSDASSSASEGGSQLHLSEGRRASSPDSYFEGSDADSEDSATLKQRAADARLTNKDEVPAGSSGLHLPAPLDVIRGTAQPDFLRPEATRPLAKPFHKSKPPLTKLQAAVPISEEPRARDIASMAPKLKGQTDAEKRGLPSGSVISAAAKKYRVDDAPGVVTAAQVAMLGGQWRSAADADAEPAPGPQPLARERRATSAMPVSEFLAKGEGGTQLPRARQERKDREKEKRARGQSAINGWKTEAEMVLRQQYD